MNPRDVQSKYFEVESIVYEDDDFAVALGYYDDDRNVPRLAMRWNKLPRENGFPLLVNGEAAWFHLPNKGIWFSEMLQAVDRAVLFHKRLKALGHEEETSLNGR
jgi:hypothetical protein